MVLVEGGDFYMGATSDQGSGDSDEKPAHRVTLSSYYICSTEVTQALWLEVMGVNPSYFIGDNLPVEMVSWNDVQSFITAINEMTGKQFRLPTEAEWEYAARGGNKSMGYMYSGSNNINEVAWYGSGSTGNASGKTHPVATMNPNELGLFDMSGNVWEWCQDWYGSYSGVEINPTGPETGSARVLRSGSWYLEVPIGPSSCRCANRDKEPPTFKYRTVGLRLAMSVE